MSSADAHKAPMTISRRSLVRGLSLLLAASPVLAACESGFQPLYGANSAGVRASERMAEVDFAPIPGRVGQRIRNEMIFQTTGGGTPAPPKYRCDIIIKETVTSTLVTNLGEARGQIYVLEASFQLVDLRDKKVVFRGASHARASFERFESIYSNVRAREDAENRAARTIADDLKTRLATYLQSA
ncbi:MAG TPA: LPS assembly lipoprotein LptE [Hyphomicrobiaceae bacterium]|nr:LPS assembly lipoprotein LptE [Hyphomicrobiaceae bacterium]